MCLVSKHSNMWNDVVSILVFHAVSFKNIISQLESTNFRAVRCFVCHVRWPNATLGHQLAPLKGFSCTKSYMLRYQVCSFPGKETCINSIMAHSEEVGMSRKGETNHPCTSLSYLCNCKPSKIHLLLLQVDFLIVVGCMIYIYIDREIIEDIAVIVPCCMVCRCLDSTFQKFCLSV